MNRYSIVSVTQLGSTFYLMCCCWFQRNVNACLTDNIIAQAFTIRLPDFVNVCKLTLICTVFLCSDYINILNRICISSMYTQVPLRKPWNVRHQTIPHQMRHVHLSKTVIFHFTNHFKERRLLPPKVNRLLRNARNVRPLAPPILFITAKSQYIITWHWLHLKHFFLLHLSSSLSSSSSKSAYCQSCLTERPHTISTLHSFHTYIKK